MIGSNEKIHELIDTKEALTMTDVAPEVPQRPKHPSDFLRLAAPTRRHHAARHSR